MVNKTFRTPQTEEEKEENQDQECAKKESGLRQEKTYPRYLYYSQLLNSVILGFFLVIISAIGVKVYFLVNSVDGFLVENQGKISSTLTSIESGSKALEQSAKAVQAVSEAQNKLITDQKTQEGIAVLLRQADDLARTVKKVNITLDKVNNEILPNTNKTLVASANTINQAGTTLRQTEKSIASLTLKGEIILDSSNSSIIELQALLAQPNLRLIVDNLTVSSAASIDTVKQLNVSVAEINKALPELLAKINEIGNNTDLSGKEITKFLGGLNTPQSKKEKSFRFLLETVIKSSPVLLRR